MYESRNNNLNEILLFFNCTKALHYITNVITKRGKKITTILHINTLVVIKET